MYDCTLKNVEDIKIGDKLMGIDGSPRTILKLYSGQDQLYKIKQARGVDYIVSSNHILSLRENWKEIRKTITLSYKTADSKYKQKRSYVRNEHTDEIINIPLQDYISKSGKWKRRHKGWKVAGIELPEREIKVDPYFLGLWLGDGTSVNTNITTADNEIINYLKEFAISNNLIYKKIKNDKYGHAVNGNSKISGIKKCNPLRTAMGSYGLLGNKHIPEDYLNNSKEVRFALLAGLIDSDGYKTGRNTYGITQVNKGLSEQIVLLTRSLGFYTTIHEYKAKMKRKDGSIYETQCHRIEFAGEDYDKIPLKIERKKQAGFALKRRYSSSFSIEPIGSGDYFGFEIDKDHLFLLEDFTVTHNTYSILQNIISLCHIRQNLIVSIVAETYPHLKRGAMRDFFHILMAEGLYSETNHNRSDSSYKIGSNMIEFFSGDKAERMKGARRDILFVNEAYGIKYDIFDQLEIRTKWCVLIDFNPVTEFWVHEELMAKNRSECAYIHSTFKDNPFLSLRIVESILRHKNSPYWWKVYGEGEVGQLEGAIFQNWRQGDFDTTLPYSFGLDFGFNDPDAMVKTAIDSRRRIMYWDEKIYSAGNTPNQLRDLIAHHCSRNDLITADCADARMIAELRKYYNIHPVDKTKWTVAEALRLMQDYEHIITEESLNLIKEFKNYMWSDKRAGIPIDGFDHLIDAGRYRFMESVKSRGTAIWHIK